MHGAKVVMLLWLQVQSGRVARRWYFMSRGIFGTPKITKKKLSVEIMKI